MRIKSQIQPLVFCFSDVDRLLSALYILKERNFKIALSMLKGRYFVTVYSSFLQREGLIYELSEFGRFEGIGMVLDAFIAEHGKRITDNVTLAKGKKDCCTSLDTPV